MLLDLERYNVTDVAEMIAYFYM